MGKPTFKKIIHLRVSNQMYSDMQEQAEAHNETHELREVASLQAWIRCAINFAIHHPNFSERVRMKLSLICAKMEDQTECPIRPSDVLYKALVDFEKNHTL